MIITVIQMNSYPTGARFTRKKTFLKNLLKYFLKNFLKKHHFWTLWIRTEISVLEMHPFLSMLKNFFKKFRSWDMSQNKIQFQEIFQEVFQEIFFSCESGPWQREQLYIIFNLAEGTSVSFATTSMSSDRVDPSEMDTGILAEPDDIFKKSDFVK